MTKVEYRRATREDLEEIVKPTDNFDMLIKSDTIIAFLVNGKAIALAGIVIVKELEVGEYWFKPAQEFLKYPHAPMAVKSAIHFYEKIFKLKRYQLTIKATQEKNIRFGEWLGYEYEGRLRAYCKGEDFLMYSRIPGGQS
jgi:RimJ/RimL family protein N-acetyltransferase